MGEEGQRAHNLVKVLHQAAKAGHFTDFYRQQLVYVCLCCQAMTVITVMVVAVDVGWICVVVVVVIVVMFMVVVMMMVMVMIVVVVVIVVVSELMHKINVVAMRCLTLMCYVFRTTSREHGN